MLVTEDRRKGICVDAVRQVVAAGGIDDGANIDVHAPAKTSVAKVRVTRHGADHHVQFYGTVDHELSEPTVLITEADVHG